jgi:hypothetical protein
MVLSVKPKPLPVCSVCQMPSVRREDLNHRCRSTFQGRRCYGTFKGGVTALWDRCQSCEGHGQVGKQPRADGFGWRIYAWPLFLTCRSSAAGASRRRRARLP